MDFFLIENVGAAIALLDSVHLPLYLNGVSFQTITYGMPRVSKNFSIYTACPAKHSWSETKRSPIMSMLTSI